MTGDGAALVALVARWRAIADTLDTWAGDGRVLRQCATELEAAVLAAGDEALTLGQAAEASGYSEAHLRRLVHDGTLANIGTDGEIRVRRGELPRKPGPRAAPVDAARHVRRVLSS